MGNLEYAIEMRLRAIEDKLGQVLDALEANPLPSKKQYYTVTEFAAKVGKATYTIREACRTGRIAARKKAHRYGVTSEWLISHEEYERYRNFGLLAPPTPGKKGVESSAR